MSALVYNQWIPWSIHCFDIYKYHVLFYQVLCVGQIIGGVLAETRELANEASSMVKVEYEEMPAIFTIEVSIEWSVFL